MTRAQRRAAKRNAALSTGPRTDEGKAASSRNAIKHNLSGSTLVLLPGEDQSAFNALVRDYTNEWRPTTPHESFLVTQMVQARWRLNRIARMEAEVLDAIFERFGDGQTDEGAMILADRVNPAALDKLHRYAKDAERSYNRAVKELRAYRNDQRKAANSTTSEKKQNEPKSQVKESAPASAVLPTPDSFPPDSFSPASSLKALAPPRALEQAA